MRCFKLLILSTFAMFTGCASTPKAGSSPSPPLPPTSASAGSTTIVAIQPPAPSSSGASLPQFLGLDSAASCICGGMQRIGSRLLEALDLTGRFPDLQPKPPVLPLTDPNNFSPDAPPAVQAAAEIKKEEDSAQQKIMAIRYLATLGCGGCYDKVEEALLEGLNDCTEAVRYEAVKALQCRPECGCRYCSSPSCCSLGVRNKLEQLTQCEKEPSARIRRQARLALACCSTKPLEGDDIPREGPTPAQPISNTASLKSQRKLFDGIQLVSFQPEANRHGDMTLAVVNGEAITKSQILALLQSTTENQRSLITPTLSEDERLRVALDKVIHWKIMEQHARNEVRLAGGTSDQPVSHSEIQNWFSRRIQAQTPISSSEISAYYDIHRDQFSTEAQMRWEEFVVYKSECSTRQEAMEIAESLKRRAEGYSNQSNPAISQSKFDVATYPWMSSSLVDSQIVAKNLATLPIGQVSPIIEDNDYLYVLRVLERKPESVRPLHECADQIRAEILADREMQFQQKMLADLRASSSVWTVFTGSPMPANSSQSAESTALHLSR